MIIDFNAMEPNMTPNMLGGEGTIEVKSFLDDAGKILMITVHPGCSIGEHTHVLNYEVCHCLKGSAKVIYDHTVEERMVPGASYYCPKGHSHTVINDTDEDMVMFCVVCGIKMA